MFLTAEIGSLTMKVIFFQDPFEDAKVVCPHCDLKVVKTSQTPPH